MAQHNTGKKIYITTHIQRADSAAFGGIRRNKGRADLQREADIGKGYRKLMKIIKEIERDE